MYKKIFQFFWKCFIAKITLNSQKYVLKLFKMLENQSVLLA